VAKEREEEAERLKEGSFGGSGKSSLRLVAVTCCVVTGIMLLGRTFWLSCGRGVLVLRQQQARGQQSRALSAWWWDEKKKRNSRKEKEDDGKENGSAKTSSSSEAASSPHSGEDLSSSASKSKASESGGTATEGSQSDPGSSIAAVLNIQGAPRQPQVLALPLDRRPLFPGLLHPIQITDKAVYEALVRTRASGNPFIGLFLRKNEGMSREFAGAEEQIGSTDRISDLSEIHTVGTFAQIVQMEPMRELTGSMDGSSGDFMQQSSGGQQVEIHNEEDQEKKKNLRKALFNEEEIRNSSNLNSSGGIQNLASAREESWTLVVKAHRKISIEKMLDVGPPPLVKVNHISEFPLSNYDQDTIRAYTNEILASLRDVIKANPLLREHMQFFSTRFDMSDPHHVCNFAASLTSADGNELQEVLEAFNLETRLKKVLTLLKKEVQVYELQQEISRQVEETISANQRKYFLNEQLKQIKKELGLEHDDKDALLLKYEKQFNALKEGVALEKDGDDAEGEEASHRFVYGALSAEAERVMQEEMKKLSTLEKTSPEFNVTRAYLDWLMCLPWGKYSVENLDVKRAKEILEADHFGLKDIKERILEFIAVGNLRGTVQGKIILLVGPPGVGKTSIGKSIAHALDREFYRFSVGGLGDVSEIKGHRRTYIGSMPGKLIQCLKSTGVSNPVVLMDEVDKLGSGGFRGDPSSALLELLDPAQNHSFVDHYLDVPVDLSKVLFVCTANTTDTIPAPLLDRMEVLRLSGYDLPEKVQIAKQYLEPRAKKESGLLPDDSIDDGNPSRNRDIKIPVSLGLDEKAIESLARWYCREAGVRSLEQHIERIYRKVSLELLQMIQEEINAKDWLLKEEDLEKYVGKRKYLSDRLYEGVPPPGVVMGLAWSSIGGSALYIESTRIRRSSSRSGESGNPQNESSKGSGDGLGLAFTVHSTGQLGEVMRESVHLAQTNAKHFLQEKMPGSNFFEKNQIHLHVPEGATPKDGPSAGITMTTALLSLAMDKPVSEDLAMTGEISLTGRVLPVGGIKEKIIAARRAGAKVLVIPDGNRKDVDELPDYLREGLEINFAKVYEDVYSVAFDNATLENSSSQNIQ